jgi:hypothetical protein
MQSNLDWFDHYIWNEPVPKDSSHLGNQQIRHS